jgi:hypothetical protein
MPTTIFTPALLASTVEVVNHGRGYRRWMGTQVTGTPGKNAYDRTGYEWSYFETTQGAYTWTKLDDLLTANWTRGQRTSIMLPDMRGGANSTYSGTFVPGYLAVAPYGVSYGGSWFPDYNHPFVIERYDAFMQAFYTRYKSDYRVESIHIPLGQYGEWYLGGSIPGYTYPSMYALKRRVDAFKIFNSGTHIKVVMMTDDEHACRYALKFAGPTTLAQPWGLARYSLGDHEHFNRLDAKYAVGKAYKRLEDATASTPNPGTKLDDAFATELRDRWKVAPFETEWYGSGMDVDPFDEAITDIQRWHIVYLSDGNLPYPPGSATYYTNLSQAQKDYYHEAGRVAGFRIAVTRMEVSTLEPSKPFTITTTWQNLAMAVTPTYDHWTPTFILKSGTTVVWEGASAYTLRGLLPGETTIRSDTFTLPAISTGTYSLYVLIKHGQFTQLSPLLPANTATQSDRSLLLGSITTGSSGGTITNQITQVGTPVNRAWTQANLDAAGNTFTLTRQADTLAGDVQLLFLGVNLGAPNLASITPTVSGFTLPTNGSSQNPQDVAGFLYYRVVQAGDANTVTVSVNASAPLQAELTCWRGVDGTTPMDAVTAFQSTSTSTTITMPAFTPTTNNGMRLGFGALAYGWNTTTLVDTATMTEIFEELEGGVSMTIVGAREQLGSAVANVAQPTRSWTAQYACHYIGLSAALRAAVVTALTAPTNLVATAASASQINLTWSAVSGAAQYIVEWAASGAGPWTALTTVTTTSASHTGLSAGMTRHYRVMAINQPSRPDSPYSATAQATTTGGTTTGLLTLVAKGGDTHTALATSISFTKPAEATAGREMLIHVFVRNSGTTMRQTVTSSHAGWTLERATHEDYTIGVHTFRRLLTGNTTNEPATLAFSWTESRESAYAWEILDNEGSPLIEVSAGGNGGSTSTTYTAGEVIPTTTTYYLYVCATAYGFNNIVPPTNYTEQSEPKRSSFNITGHTSTWQASTPQQHTPAGSGPAAGYAAQVFALRGATTTPTVPNAPTNLTITVTGTTIAVSWTDAATNETGYRVLLSRDAGMSWETVAEKPAGATSHSLATMSPGVYRVAVEAYNVTGSTRATSGNVTVTAAGGGGTGGGIGRTRLHLAIYDADDYLVADWTATARGMGVVWTTGPRGYQDLTGTIRMSRDVARAWSKRAGIYTVRVRAGSTVVWEGRLEDRKPTDQGLAIKAFGAGRALTDTKYTRLWSVTEVDQWSIVDTNYTSDLYATPDRFQFTMTDRIFITTRANTSHGSQVIAYAMLAAPHRSRSGLRQIRLNYKLAPGTGPWECGVQVRDADWNFISNPWSLLSTNALQTGSLALTLPDVARVLLYFRYTPSGELAIPDNPGRYYAEFSHLRVTSTDGPVTVPLIAADVLASIREQNPDQLSARTDLIQDPGFDLTKESFEDAIPADMLGKLVALGDTQVPPRLWETVVWNDRVLAIQPRGATGRRWRMRIAVDEPPETSMDGVINRAYGIHRNRRGETVRTAAVVDTQSVEQWGIVREDAYRVDTIAEAQARAVRDMELADRAHPAPRATSRVLEVFTEQGYPVPKWMVRSGDTAIPIGSRADDDTFIIAETRYSADTDDLTISPDVPTPSVVTALARRERGIR